MAKGVRLIYLYLSICPSIYHLSTYFYLHVLDNHSILILDTLERQRRQIYRYTYVYMYVCTVPTTLCCVSIRHYYDKDKGSSRCYEICIAGKCNFYLGGEKCLT